MAAGYLTLEELVKEFPGPRGTVVRAVDQVDVTLERGQLMTLLGPSGCGKTTTLRLIAGFEESTAGRIVLDGRVMNDVPANRRGMAMVFQSYAIFPHLDVYENVAYGLRVQRLAENEIKRRVLAVLELVEMAGLERRQPAQLSGGQQQRVALARALVMEPKVLLFDEPLSNLDARLRLQMREQIRAIQQQLGITAVYVTHDQSEAMALSDVIVVMNQGRVEQIGPPPDLYRRPSSAFVADFIGKANLVPGVVERVDGESVSVRALGIRLQVPTDGPAPSPGQITLVIRPDAVNLVDAVDGCSGLVQRATFLGGSVEYEVEVAGERLSIVENDPRCRTPLPVGSEVGVMILEDCLAMLPSGQL